MSKLGDALRELDSRATDGPWRDVYNGMPGTARQIAPYWPGQFIAAVSPRQHIRTDRGGGAYPSNDAKLIVAIRNALPELAALADEAEWMRDKLRKMYPGGIDYELRVAAVLAKLNPDTAPEKGDRR